MSTTIKVLNANKEIAVHQVKKGTPLVIQAQDKVNYQLIDDAKGFAPQNIIVHRNNNHLIIALDDGDSDADIVIENYYANGQTSNLLVGQYENGKMYAYVPESGEVKEAVSILTENMTAAQALGGRELATPVWTEYTQNWWIALAPLALVAAIAFAIKKHNNNNNDDNQSSTDDSNTTDTTAPEAPTVTVSSDGTTVSGTAEAGSTISVDTNGDGVVDATTVVGSDKQYSIALATPLTNGQTIAVTATDEAGNISTATTTTAQVADTTAPEAPTVTVSSDGLTISGTAEANSKVNIDTNGDGVADVTVTADAQGTYATILPTALTNGQTVSVTATDASGNTSTATTQTAQIADTTAPEVPTATLSSDGLTISGKAEAGATIRVDINQDGQVDATVVADNNGDYEVVLSEPVVNGEVLSITAEDVAGNVSDALVLTASDTTAPEAPLVFADISGSVSIIPQGEDAVKFTVQYTATDDTVYTLEFTKANGLWVDGNANDTITIDENSGAVILAADAVKDNTEVVATAYDAANNSAENSAFAADHTAPASPKIVEENGQLLITPDAEAIRMNIEYVNTQGEIAEALFTQDDTGQWVDNNSSDALTVDKITGVVTLPLTFVEGGSPVTVTNYDLSGLGSAASVDTVDTTAPNAPVSISVGNGDAYLTLGEISDGKVNVSIQLPVGTVYANSNLNTDKNDILVINGTDYVLSSSNVAISYDTQGNTVLTFTWETDAPAEGETLKIVASLRDAAGNVSSELSQDLTRDTIVPGDSNGDGVADRTGALRVVINDAKETSGYINASDLNDNGKVSVSITFPADSGYRAGDILVVTLPDGTTSEISITEEMLSNGTSVEFDPIEGANTVSAYVKDAAGNQSTISSDKSSLDDSVALAPTVTIVDEDDNGYLNAADMATTNNQATAHIDIPSGYEVGNTLVVTLPNNSSQTFNLTEDDLLTGIDITFTAQEGTNTVTAKLTNTSGTTSQVATAEIVVDTQITSTAPIVTIADIDADGYINASELSSGKVTVNITFPANGGYVAGDILTVTDAAGNKQTVTLTDEIIANGTSVTVTPIEGDNLITATVSDVAGNQSNSGTDSSILDNGVPGDSDKDGSADGFGSPIVTLQDGGDGYINPADLNGDDKVNVVITFPRNSGYSVGDTLIVTEPNGDKQEIVLTAEYLQNGVTVAVTPVIGSNTVTATVKDVQGNQSFEGLVESQLETSTPFTPRISVSDGGDGQLNATELSATQNKVNASVKVPMGAVAGDILTITSNGNSQEITLDDAQISAGKVDISFDAQEGNNTITAVLTNTQGVQSSTSETVVVADTVAPNVATLTANDDGSVTVTVPDNAQTGDMVTVKLTQPNNTETTVTLTKQSNGAWTSSQSDVVPNIASDATTSIIPANKVLDNSQVTAISSDIAGNQATEATATAGIGGDPDVTAPATPTVNLSGDGLTISGTAEAGSTVKIDTNGDSVADVTVTANDQGAYTTTLSTALTNGETISVTATDASGNTSDVAKTTANDTTAPAVPTATIATDGLTVSGTAEANATVNIDTNNDGTADITATADAQGAYTATLTTALSNGESIKVSATDKAGNTSEAITATAGDTTPPSVTAVVADNGLSVSGQTEAGAIVKVDANNDGVADVTVTANSQGEYIAPLLTALIKGETVSVTATDASGNTSEAVSATAPIKDVIAPNAPVAEVSADGTTVSGTAEANATVKVTVNGQENGSAVANATGQYTITLTTPVKNSESLSVTATDEAGNVSDATTVTAPDLTAPTTLSAQIANDGITITGTTEANATVKVDVNGDGTTETTAQADATGSFTATLTTAVLNGETISLTATDTSGNTGTAITITAPDSTAPSSLTATLASDGVTITGTTEANATVKVDVNGDGVVETTTQANDAGEYTATLGSALSNGETISVTATDTAGNEGTAVVLTAQDTTPPDAPSVFANSNGAVSIVPVVESTASLNVTYTVTDTGASRTVTFTKDSTGQWIDGDNTDNVTVEAQTGLVTIAADEVADNTEVVATAYDAAGNSISNSAISIDHTPPKAPTIEADSTNVIITPDSEAVVLIVEYVDASGSIVEARFEKDILGNGNWFVLDASNSAITINAQTGVATLALAQVEGGSSVTARNADSSYLFSGADFMTTDTIAPNAPVSMTVGNNDAYLTASEISDGNVSVVIKLPEGLRANSDILVVNGTEYTLSADDISNGSYTATVVAPTAEGSTLTITATLKDTSGNVSPELSQTLTRDTQVPGDSNKDGVADRNGTPTVIIEDAEETSGYINASDLLSNGKVAVSISLPTNSGYQVGDILVITEPDGSTQEVEITEAILTNGLKVEVEPTAGVNTVSAYVRDEAGNQSLTGSKNSTLDDSVALAPNISITSDADENGYVNAKEVATGQQVTAHIEIPAGYEANNKLVVTLPNQSTQEFILTKDDLRTGVNVTFTVTEGQNTISATLTNTAGVVSKTASSEFTVDTVIASTAPSVTINTGNDEALNPDEITDGKVNVAIAIAQDKTVVAGDILTVRSNGATQTIELTQAQIDAGTVTVQVVAPTAIGETLNVEAVITDVAQNTSATGSDSAVRSESQHLVFSTDSGLGENITDAVNTSDDSDTIQVNGYLQAYTAAVTMGGGDDTLSVLGYVAESASINMGSGADTVTLGDSALGTPVVDANGNSVAAYAVVDLGDGNDTLSVYGALDANAVVNAGAGTDSLRLSGNGVSYTLNSNIQGFESIDLSSTDGSKNTLTLTTDGVISNSREDSLTVDTVTYSNVLMIEGSTGDEVTLWDNANTNTQQVTYENNNYNVYSYTQNDVTYNVWIDSDITVK